jgi:hypothetical protein
LVRIKLRPQSILSWDMVVKPRLQIVQATELEQRFTQVGDARQGELRQALGDLCGQVLVETTAQQVHHNPDGSFFFGFPDGTGFLG